MKIVGRIVGCMGEKETIKACDMCENQQECGWVYRKVLVTTKDT